jgi:hypothetical protein
LLALFNLEEIVVLVLDLSISVRSVFDELSFVNDLVLEVHLASSYPLVIVPLAFVPLAVRVEHDALPMPSVVRVAAIVVRPVREQDLHAAMGSRAILEPTFNDLVRT